jgi:hypothetical protein
VKHFLVVFNRPHGRVVSTTEFADRSSALRARFELEREYAASQDVEIVVLGAASKAALEKTHARYFQSAGDLARSGASRVEHE